MQYRYFVVTVALILALVMTSGCTGLLMGDLKAEIHDSSSITVPLPLSSVLSVLVSQNTTTSSRLPCFRKEKKGNRFWVIRFLVISVFHVKSSSEDPTGIDSDGIKSETDPSSQVGESGIPPRAPPGDSVKPLLGTCIL